MVKELLEVDFEETRWGGYDTIEHYNRGELETKLKRLFINPNQNISYQRHEKRAEAWTVLDGSGVIIVDGEAFSLTIGCSISIPVGSWHAVQAGENGLEIVEVQVGTKCSEDDIERLYYDWNDILVHVELVNDND
jgi:mannose-1-phosphate guanylyltransferase